MAPEAAGMLEHSRAIVRQTFVEPDCGTAARQHLGETLLAIDQFMIPQIVALHFNQVERDQGDVMITATAPQRVEIGDAVIAANNGLAIKSGTIAP
jgi:hypothetical protein